MPLTPGELAALVPTSIATRAELDAAEQANIEAATRWAFGGRPVTVPEVLLTIEFSDHVHHQLYGDVWQWAGRHCTGRTATNVEPYRIDKRLTVIFDDARYRHEHPELFPPSERAIKLSEKLLEVCAYPGGNGRHARFMADLYLHIIGEPRIEWGSTREMERPAIPRRPDLSALQRALDAATRDNAKRHHRPPG
jgi:Fic-DOC domain mobile mystery protein B